jgi:glycosyltransferase involved in cell wall biosynthesis
MKVSVIIPTYNRFEYVLNAIESVKNQTYKDVEVIVVNDCSTQQEYYTDHPQLMGDNVFLTNLPKNSRDVFGIVSPGGHARNIGMMLASGDYIAFLDDDDYWLPEKLEKQISQMEAHDCKSLIEEAGYFPIMSFADDWAYWKKIIQYSNCVALKEALVYIDAGHGDGKNY